MEYCNCEMRDNGNRVLDILDYYLVEYEYARNVGGFVTEDDYVFLPIIASDK